MQLLRRQEYWHLNRLTTCFPNLESGVLLWLMVTFPKVNIIDSWTILKSAGSDGTNSHTRKTNEWLQRCDSQNDEYSETFHSKTKRISPGIGLDTGFLSCCVTIQKPTSTTFQNKLEYRFPLRHRNGLKPERSRRTLTFWPYVLRTGEKMIRTAVRAAALAKMLGFVKVLSYIGLWRTVLTGSMVTRMVTLL